MNAALLRVISPALLLVVVLGAQEPAVVVDSKPLVTTRPPVHLDGELFLPLGPLARALGATIAVRPDLTIQVHRADGANLNYDGRSGEIRSGAVLAGQVAKYRLVLIVADADQLLFPLAAIVPLLGVNVRYDDQTNTLYLDSAPRATTAPSPGFVLTDVSYQYGLTTNGSIFGENASVRGTALTGATTLSGQVQATRAPSSPVYLNQASLRADLPSGRAILLGDQAIYAGIDALSNSVRGLGYEQKLAEFTAYLYGGQAIGSVAALFGASVPHYDTKLAGYSMRRADQTGSISFGLNVFENPQRKGATLGIGFGRRIARNQFNVQGAGGFFTGLSLHTIPLDQLKAEAGLLPTTVNGVPVPSDTVAPTPTFEMTRFIQVHGPAYGVTASDAFLPVPQISVSSQVDYYSANFLTAREDTRFNGANTATVAVSIRPLRQLTLNGSTGNREFLIGDPRRNRSYTYGATLQLPGAHAPQIGMTRTVQLDDALGVARFELTQYSILLPNWGRYSTSVFYSQTVLGNVRITDLNALSTVDLRRYGRFSVHYQSQFGSNRRIGGDWYCRLGDRDGYLRFGVDQVRIFGGSRGLLPLVGIRLPLPRRQMLEISYLRDITTQLLQFQLGGKLMSPHEILRDSHGVPRINARTTITGLVYMDHNHNGSFDDGDRGVADTTVWLDGGTVVHTDPHGYYRFNNLEPGAHTIRVEISGIPAGFVFAGSNQNTIDTVPNRENRVDFRVILTGRIEGSVIYLDYSQDADNPRESPLPDAHILATDGSDTYTESNGSFLLGDLPPGRFELRLDPASLPKGYVSRPASITVIVTPGAVSREVRFKLMIPPKPVIEIKAPDQRVGLSDGSRQDH